MEIKSRAGKWSTIILACAIVLVVPVGIVKDIINDNITADLANDLGRLKAKSTDRLLTNEQESAFVGEIRLLPRVLVNLCPIPDTFEGNRLATQLMNLLKLANVDAYCGIGIARVNAGPSRDVAVHFVTGNNDGKTFAMAFARSLSVKGIRATATGGLEEDQVNSLINPTAAKDRNDNKFFGWILIIVGDR